MAVLQMGLASEANTGVYTCLLKEFEFFAWQNGTPELNDTLLLRGSKECVDCSFSPLHSKLSLQLTPWKVCKIFKDSSSFFEKP